jgi:predicted anti-sigma-YlaC factor YlaD
MKDSYDCEACFNLLLDYLEDDLEDEQKAKIEAHIKTCGPCINYFQTYEKTTQLLNILKEQEATVPKSTQERIKDFVMKQSQLSNNG